MFNEFKLQELREKWKQRPDLRNVILLQVRALEKSQELHDADQKYIKEVGSLFGIKD